MPPGFYNTSRDPKQAIRNERSLAPRDPGFGVRFCSGVLPPIKIFGFASGQYRMAEKEDNVDNGAVILPQQLSFVSTALKAQRYGKT